MPFDGAGLDVPPMDTPALDTPELDAPAFDVPGLDAPDVPSLFDVPPRGDTPFDAGPTPDVPLASDDAAPCTDLCLCGFHRPPCGPGDTCDPGQVCIDDGCLRVCVPSGAECSSNVDCPEPSTCRFNGETLSCSLPATGCVDSRNCSPGFACIAGTCTDRRIGCGGPDGVADCPMNFYCDSSNGPPHCSRVLRPCGTSTSCPATTVCFDVDNDGDGECVAPGMCDDNTDCPARSTCQTEPIALVASCGRYGPCRNDGDCAADEYCVDIWGDGVRECIDIGSDCERITDCPTGSICGTPLGGGPTQCISRPFPL